MKGKTRVAIIGTNGLPANYGGFETLTHHLVVNLAHDFDITVYCSKTPHNKRVKTFNNARLKYFPFKANGWQSVIYDFVTIFHAYLYAENLIILGFSGAFAFPFNKLFRRNIVFNIGGIEWQKVRGSKWSATLEIKVKKWMEKMCVRNAQTVIIDNLSFSDYLEKEYNIKPLLAEYGGDHAEKVLISGEMVKKYPFLAKPYDLTVSRAQQDMNIHLVIDAYKSVPQRTVVIISNWHISTYGQQLYSDYCSKYDNIILLKAIYEPAELNMLRSNCEIYLHTHSLCGTAPSLVEAMSLELPVISFDVPANRATTEDKAFFFKDVPDLSSILKNLTTEETEKNRGWMKKIALNRYKWKKIAELYKSSIR